MRSICAVIVTFNRKAMLEHCLATLKVQTHPPTSIVIIDNGSSDGTRAMLDAMDDHRLLVTSLAKNTGAAGGFNLGMRLAYETGADFIWAMDDDVFPDPDALEHLLATADQLRSSGRDFPFLISAARSTTGLLTEVPDIDRRPNALGFPDWAALLDHGIVPVRGATFASILIPRGTFLKHGLPIAAMFIFGEDRDFTIRVTQERPGYLVGNSRVVHARKLEGALDTRTETDPVRLRYHHFLHRNTTATILRYDSLSRRVLHLWRQFTTVLYLGIRGRFGRAQVVAWGTISGLFFRPSVEKMPSIESASPGNRATPSWTDKRLRPAQPELGYGSRT
jgi:dTDP-4-dehydrorhamnose reductase